LDQIGPIAKTVGDAAIILSGISGEDKMDATAAKSADKIYENYLTDDIKNIKIGIPEEYLNKGLDNKILEKYFRFLAKFDNNSKKRLIIKLTESKETGEQQHSYNGRYWEGNNRCS
jgi:Asp-tRNA(Asn)/Glu-tRNA(Gln) amidotransferase A subunit family amidase